MGQILYWLLSQCKETLWSTGWLLLQESQEWGQSHQSSNVCPRKTELDAILRQQGKLNQHSTGFCNSLILSELSIAFSCSLCVLWTLKNHPPHYVLANSSASMPLFPPPSLPWGTQNRAEPSPRHSLCWWPRERNDNSPTSQPTATHNSPNCSQSCVTADKCICP